MPGRDGGDLRRPRRQRGQALDRRRDHRRRGRRDRRRQHRLPDRAPRRPRRCSSGPAASRTSASACSRSATRSSSATGRRPSSSAAGSRACASGPRGSPGASDMRWPTFLVWNALGGTAWATSVGARRLLRRQGRRDGVQQDRPLRRRSPRDRDRARRRLFVVAAPATSPRGRTLAGLSSERPVIAAGWAIPSSCERGRRDVGEDALALERHRAGR